MPTRTDNHDRRHLVGNVRTLPPTDDFNVHVANGGVTTLQEQFVQAWLRTGNRATAYRTAYNVSPNTVGSTIYAAASRIASLPAVQRRYEELLQQSALECIVDLREALRYNLDIATADPNDLATLRRYACRYCYGVDHAYQWKDENEYVAACVKAMDDGDVPPTDEGGYGYAKGMEPVVTCPECLGDGHAEIVIADTTKLTGKARRLYKGLDYKGGEWVVQMHDQQRAWELVTRMLGGFDAKLSILFPQAGRGPDMKTVTNEQDATAAYLSMIE